MCHAEGGLFGDPPFVTGIDANPCVLRGGAFGAGSACCRRKTMSRGVQYEAGSDGELFASLAVAGRTFSLPGWATAQSGSGVGQSRGPGDQLPRGPSLGFAHLPDLRAASQWEAIATLTSCVEQGLALQSRERTPVDPPGGGA